MDILEILKLLTKSFAVLTILCMIYAILVTFRERPKLLHPSLFLGIGLLTMMSVSGTMMELVRRSSSPLPTDPIVLCLIGVFTSVIAMTVSYFALWKKRSER